MLSGYAVHGFQRNRVFIINMITTMLSIGGLGNSWCLFINEALKIEAVEVSDCYANI